MLEKLKSSVFVKNIVLLSSGTAIAQLIPILISPILTRLYLPESFGVLMVYVSVISILGVIATGRYEKAIIIPKSNETSQNLVRLTQVLISGFIIILALINFFWGPQLLTLVGASAIIPYSWLILIGIFILSSDQNYYYWANRISAYKRMSLAKISNNISSGISAIIFGLLSMEALGLLYSKLLGLFASLVINLQTFSVKLLRELNWGDLKTTAKDYRKFPVFLMPGQLMNAVSTNGPPIALAFFYSETIVGWFALTQRVIMMPVSIIARSVGDVFRQKATEMYNEHGSYRSLYLKTMAVLTLVGLIPFLTLIFFAPLLFTWVFGADWTNAGEFAQILAILFIFQFVTSPLTNAFIISDKQQLELLWQIVFLLSSILPIIIGFYLYEEIQSVLLLFAASRAGAYILSIFLTLPFTEKRV